jgi:hypothetical protein
MLVMHWKVHWIG